MRAARAIAAALAGLVGPACVGSPPPPPPLPAPTPLDLGDGKLLVTCRQDDRVLILDPAHLSDADNGVVARIHVGFDPFAPPPSALPHEALVGPDVFGDGERSWFVTIQQGSYTWSPVKDAGAAADACDHDANPHCDHQGGTIPGGVERRRVRDNALLGRAEVGYAAAQMAFMPDGSKMYVTAFNAIDACGHVAILNPRTMTQIRVLDDLPRQPHGLALTPDGKLLVVATYWDRVVIIPTDDERKENRTVLLAGDDVNIGECEQPSEGIGPRHIPNTVAMAPDGTRAYVSMGGNPPEIVAVDLATRTLDPDFRVRTKKGPQQVVLTPDGNTILVPCSGESQQAFLDAIDVRTKQDTHLELDRSGGGGIWDVFGISVSPDGQTAWLGAGCGDWGGGTCQSTGMGGIEAIDLSGGAPAFRGVKVKNLCRGVTHVSFARNPP